jgi:Cu(I)/Ag(I) efflux system membrane protein CusA/SilA
MPENKDAKGRNLINVIYTAMIEVSPAVLTALGTTVVSFLPVFTMQATEGKLFRPLAFTKTYALLASFVLGLIVLPTLANIFFSVRFDKKRISRIFNSILIAAGILFAMVWGQIPALALVLVGLNNLLEYKWPEKRKEYPNYIRIGITVLVALWYLSIEWLPLGASNTNFTNYLFAGTMVALILSVLMLIVHFYIPILNWTLRNKWKFMTIPMLTVLFGILAWLGVNRIFWFMPDFITETKTWQSFNQTFRGTGKEFMPALDEGSFLLMPTSMPHSGIEKNTEYVRLLDQRLMAIPEVDMAVGKWGRVNSALDPAPVQMFENTINYLPEYILDEHGHRMTFRVDREGNFLLKDSTSYHPGRDGFRKIAHEQLIPDKRGEYFRQWRPEIKSTDDIWNEIVKVTSIPGLTSAPRLQPIQTRLVMLSTGMRAPLGLKVYGPDLEAIEKAGMQLEMVLKEIPSIQGSSVFYDRAVGAPYIEIKLNREAIARYGMTISDVQDILQVAVGGMPLTKTVEGRERFPVRVRYARELRNTPEEIRKILVPSMTDVQVPLGELAHIDYARGTQMIRSENTFLNGYVIFDKIPGIAEVDVVEEAQRFLKEKIDQGELILPHGVSYTFAGNYENQIRASKRLAIVIPISLALVFLLLYFQFKTFTASSIHFSGVFVAFAGGFIMLWLYNQPWFLNFSIAGTGMRHLFQIHTINLSVAVWVGFIALFGIATDDGVLMGTYIHQVFEEKKPKTIQEVREAVIIAGRKRVRPAMMTTAVAIIALLPVLSSTGKGSDIMVPMAIPTFGGMIIQIMTIFVVPVLQCFWREGAVNKQLKRLKNASK